MSFGPIANLCTKIAYLIAFRETIRGCRGELLFLGAGKMGVCGFVRTLQQSIHTVLLSLARVRHVLHKCKHVLANFHPVTRVTNVDLPEGSDLVQFVAPL